MRVERVRAAAREEEIEARGLAWLNLNGRCASVAEVDVVPGGRAPSPGRASRAAPGGCRGASAGPGSGASQ